MIMSETHKHHRVRNSIILLLLGGVAYVANEKTDAIDNLRRINAALHESHLGLKNINLGDDTQAAQTGAIGTATSGCIAETGYGTGTVHRIRTQPDEFVVYVRKVGQGTLDAAAVEACIFDHTHLKTSVIEGK